MEGNSTQIDELRLDITVEDKTSGDSSDKRVRKLATAISTLNKNLKAFDNAKFSKTFENMAKGIEPFVNKIESVSSALESLATIVKKSGLDKAVEQVSGKMPELKTKDVQGVGGEEKPIQGIGIKSQQFGEAKADLEDIDDSLRDIDNKWDLLGAKAIEVAKSLDKEKLTNKQILSLVSQRLSIENQLNQMTKKQENAQQLAEAQAQAQKFRDSLSGITDKVALMKIQLEQVQNAIQQGGLNEKQYLTLKKQELSLVEKINKAESGGGDDDGKKTEKKATSLGKLVKSFGRIAMYRAVRRIIQEITQAFTESIDGIAKYNSEFRDTMGSLQSSLAKVKTSMGVAFYQVLILIEPLITNISNGIVNLANSLSKVTANLRGTAEYTKINTEYMKQYQSATQGALLSFDTFNTLSSNQGIDYSQMIDTGMDALDTEGFTNTENSLKRIFKLIQTIGNVAQKIWNGGLKDIMSTILDIVIDIASWVAKGVDYISNIDLGNITSLEALLWGVTGVLAVIAIKNLIVAATNPFTLIALAIAAVVAAIAVLIANWDTVVNFLKTTCEKIGNFFTELWHRIANGFANIINGICNTFIAFVNVMIEGLNALSSPINRIGRAFGASENFAQIPYWEAKVNWKPYANGGMFEGAGTMYALAGESGAEVVATGSAGTGVLNVDQFADSMVSALVRYGAARDTSNGTTIVLDGNKVGQLVASNVGFRNEANRRNAGLNWK